MTLDSESFTAQPRWPTSLSTARSVRRLAGWLLLVALSSVAPGAAAQGAVALRARHALLREALAVSPFQRPLVLESAQVGDALKGEVHAVVAQPFAVVSHALQGIDHWCDILILHLNVKRCRALATPTGGILRVAIGRKHEQPPDEAFQVELAYRLVASSADFLEVRLDAPEGPLGTRDYRIVVQAVALGVGTSFVRLSYSYDYGLAARLAMKAYLATLGRDKVGFSIVGRQADGSPVYVGDVRGAVERNTMRYYLAIEAYLDACRLPPAEQPLYRLKAWFDAVERHPRQLHELSREEYLSMKRREAAQAAAPAGC